MQFNVALTIGTYGMEKQLILHINTSHTAVTFVVNYDLVETAPDRHTVAIHFDWEGGTIGNLCCIPSQMPAVHLPAFYTRN